MAKKNSLKELKVTFNSFFLISLIILQAIS